MCLDRDRSISTDGSDIAGAVRSASNFDDETDGIDAAMRDVSGPVTVLIPEGEGSGPNGEWVIGEKYAESDVYQNQTDVPVGVKVDKDDVTFLGLGMPTITVDANNACHTFLPSSYANTTGFYPGDRLAGIELRNLKFDGKRRDGIAYSFYESEDCELVNCEVTNWVPTSGGSGTFFDDVAVRMQHHADRITHRDCVFRVDTNINAIVKNDGGWNNRFENCKWLDGGGSARPFRQNANGDFGEDLDGDSDDEVRFADGLVFNDCLFQGSFGDDMSGLGNGPIRFVSTDFRPDKYTEQGPTLSVETRDGEAGSWNTHFDDCEFWNTDIQFRNNDAVSGFQVADSRIHQARDTAGYAFIKIIGGVTSDGHIYDLSIKNNWFTNRQPIVTTVGSTNRNNVVRIDHGNVTGLRVEGNSFDGWRGIIDDNSSGALTVGDQWVSRDNEGNRDDLYSSAEPHWSENSGTEADAVAIGLGDSTGNVTVSVTHNLIATPSAEDIRAFLSGASAQDYAAYVKEVRNIGSSSFDVVVHIDSLCSTTGETVDLSWEAAAVPSWMKR